MRSFHDAPMAKSWAIIAGVAAAICVMADSAHAVDEIQVYNGEIAKPGQFTLQQQFNYAFNGRKEPDFDGGLIPHRALNGTPELAYGVNSWYELGLHLPYAVNREGDAYSNGMKIRHLFVVPDADKRDFSMA